MSNTWLFRRLPFIGLVAICTQLLYELYQGLAFSAVFQDLTSLLVIGSLAPVAWGASNSIVKSYRQGQTSRAAMISLGAALLGFVFYAFWWSRWSGGLAAGLHAEQVPQHPTFLRAAAILALVAFALRSIWFARLRHQVDATPGRKILAAYFAAAAVATVALIMPWSLQPGAALSLIDAFFVSISALSVTGLSPVNIATTFSRSGQWVILGVIQIGGLGIIAISAGLAAMTRKRMSLSESMLGRQLFDVPHVGQMSTFIGQVVFITLICELIGFGWIYLCLPSDLPGRSFHALFHAVSAFCNAGFSTLERNLETPGIIGARIGIAWLVIIGGLGFPVLLDGIKILAGKCKNGRLPAESQLTCMTSVALLVVGAIGIALVESLSGESKMGLADRIGQSVFYSVSARTAGFNILPVELLTQPTQLILMALMVIGGGPLSTAGGIKTSTAGVIFAAVYSLLRGNKWIQYRDREIPAFGLQKAVSIVVLYFSVALGASILLMAIEQHDPLALTFEVVSALSTTGLSMGMTAQLSSVSKLLVIALMLTGRLGLVTMVYVGMGRIAEQRYRYPQSHFYVG